MNFDEHARGLLIEYRRAHLLWKSLPEGAQKVEAKRERGRLHGKVLELAELCEAKAPEN